MISSLEFWFKAKRDSLRVALASCVLHHLRVLKQADELWKEVWNLDGWFHLHFQRSADVKLTPFIFHSQSRFFYQRNSYTQQSCVITPEAVFPLHDYVSLQQTAVIFLTTHCSTNKSHWRVNVPTGHCTLTFSTLVGLWRSETACELNETWRALPAEAGNVCEPLNTKLVTAWCPIKICKISTVRLIV